MQDEWDQLVLPLGIYRPVQRSLYIPGGTEKLKLHSSGTDAVIKSNTMFPHRSKVFYIITFDVILQYT